MENNIIDSRIKDLKYYLKHLTREYDCTEIINKNGEFNLLEYPLLEFIINEIKKVKGSLNFRDKLKLEEDLIIALDDVINDNYLKDTITHDVIANKYNFDKASWLRLLNTDSVLEADLLIINQLVPKFIMNLFNEIKYSLELMHNEDIVSFIDEIHKIDKNELFDIESNNLIIKADLKYFCYLIFVTSKEQSKELNAKKASEVLGKLFLKPNKSKYSDTSIRQGLSNNLKDTLEIDQSHLNTTKQLQKILIECKPEIFKK